MKTMAVASNPFGVRGAIGGVVSRDAFREFERGNVTPCYDNFARNNPGSSVNGNLACRRMSFCTSVMSPLFIRSISNQIRSSVASQNCTSRVSTGIVASLDHNAKPQKKQQPSMDDLLPDFDELTQDELQTYLNLELQSGLDMNTYKHYEIMFIIHEKHVDEVQVVIDKVTGFVLENKGFIYRINDWGLRRLAYKIQKAGKGNYVLMNIEINASVINDLNTMFEKDERVIRHMVMSQKEAISDDMESPEEWQPSSAYAEGGEAEVEEEEEYYEDYDEGEGGEEEQDEQGGQRNGELILERQK